MVQYIQLDGIEYPIFFPFGALREFSKMTGKDTLSFSNLSFEDLDKQLFVALKWGAKKEQKDFDLTVEIVGELMDNLTIAEYTEIMEKVAGMIEGDKAKQNGLPTEKKLTP